MPQGTTHLTGEQASLLSWFSHKMADMAKDQPASGQVCIMHFHPGCLALVYRAMHSSVGLALPNDLNTLLHLCLAGI